MSRCTLAAVGAFALATFFRLSTSSAETKYVAFDAQHSVAIKTAPLPVFYVGGLVVDLHEQVRRAAFSKAPVPDGGLGLPTADVEVQESAYKDLGVVPALAMVTPPDGQRIVVMRVKTTFVVGAERKHIRVLRLRARYHDAIVARLNGREIIRRNQSLTAIRRRFSDRTHGPEWETFYIPLDAHSLRAGKNYLSLFVRPSAYKRKPELEYELSGGERARFDRGPLVQRVAVDSASVVFETDIPTAAEIHFGLTADKLDRVASATASHPIVRHVVGLDKLPKSSRVHYKVVTPFGETSVRSFQTAPQKNDVVRFALFGDVRSGHVVHEALTRAVTTEAPDFVITTGDQVMRGSDEGDWQRFFEIAGPLLATTPYYPVLGNHDRGAAGDRQRRFDDVFLLWPGPANRPVGAGWYSFDVADIHFVMLDSNRYHDVAQLAWLEQDLVKARGEKKRAIFVATHHGPYARGPHGGHTLAAAVYVPLLRRYNVAMIFAGHDHIYQRGKMDGMNYIVSGGGGASLYPVKCGVPGRPRCKVKDGAFISVREHHYVMVDVYRDYVRLCPRRPDGTAIEECVSLPLPK